MNDDYRLGTDPKDRNIFEENISNIQLRYRVEEGNIHPVYGREFDVWDDKEQQRVCSCESRKYAGLIAGCLNRDWNMIQDEDAVNEMGG